MEPVSADLGGFTEFTGRRGTARVRRHHSNVLQVKKENGGKPCGTTLGRAKREILLTAWKIRAAARAAIAWERLHDIEMLESPHRRAFRPACVKEATDIHIAIATTGPALPSGYTGASSSEH